MKVSRFLPATAALAAGTLLLAGCGESDDGADSGSLERAEAIVQEYAEKLMSGDVSACALESDKYKEEQQRMLGEDDCAERIKSLVTADEPAIDLSDATYTASKESDGTRVAVVFPDGEAFEGADVAFSVVEDGDSWLVDGSERIDDKQASDSGKDVGSDEAAANAAADSLAKAYCDVNIGAGRDEVVGLMGEPDSTSPDGGATKLTWVAKSNSYTIWFDNDFDRVASMTASAPREPGACDA